MSATAARIMAGISSLAIWSHWWSSRSTLPEPRARAFRLSSEYMFQDLRLGLRLLWKDKTFTLTAALTLALCIGANTALFSVVHNVLLRPLPVPESERVRCRCRIEYPGVGESANAGQNSSVPDYYDRLRETTVFEEQALYNGRNQSVDQNGTPTRMRVMNVTPSFFRLLCVLPFGRTFTDSEGEIGNERKVILSDGLWRSSTAAIRRSSEGTPPRRPAVHDRRRDAPGLLF